MNMVSDILGISRACLAALVLAVAVWYGLRLASFPIVRSTPASEIKPLEWPAAGDDCIAMEVDVFRKTDMERPVASGPLGQMFRLAGTFFAVGARQQSRMAVIDVLKDEAQQLVAEGEWLQDNVLVKSIFHDRVVLAQGDQEEEIWLSFSSSGAGIGPHQGDPTGKKEASSVDVLGRFGKRVGERKWVLDRAAVLGYYQELLNDTERLANVFASMKPVYEGNDIRGYVLDVEGEGEFFNAFGLHQGDIVRKVNSMPMTNRNRAEYFIKEFVADRANAFVLDVERDGNPQRLVYMVR